MSEQPEIPNRRDPKQITMNAEQLKDLLYNQSSRDQTFLKRFFDPRRDIDNECGYPGLGESPEITQYKAFYDTHCVATRVCEIHPLETWQVQPSVFEDDDPGIQTEFEKAWDELGAGLRGQSYHKNEEGSPVWNYLLNADILSGIGSFGIILLGFDDGRALNEPIAMLSDEDEDEEKTWDTSEVSDDDEDLSTDPTVNQLGSIDAQYTGGSSFANDKIPKLKEGTKRKLIYMRAFDESLVQITRLELDRTSPRYGQPLMYRVTLLDPELAKSQSISMDLSCPEVHWSRVIHIAETKGSNSEVFGIPRQQQVWRQLLNLYKLYGGAPEMYWRGALNGLSFETHPQLGGDVDIDIPSLKNQIENLRNGLQRDILTTAMTVKSIAPTVVDPTPNIEIQIQALCIKLACPQRIFMGSERGELASSQDDSSWNDRLKNRQDTYVTPRIIIPFVDRMIATGVLPKPANRIIAQDTQDPINAEQGIDSEETGVLADKNPLYSSQGNGNGKPKESNKLLANAFPPANGSKIAPNAPKNASNGQNGTKPAFGKPDATSDSTASGATKSLGSGQAMAPPAPKKRVLPAMEESPGYCIVWPDLDSMTDLQKAQIGLARTQAFIAFITGNGESAMTLISFWTKFMYMSDEEAIAMIEAVNEQIDAESRITPDPEEARQDELDMQGEQFDKELAAKKDLAEQGHGFGMEMQESQQSFADKMADKTLKAKSKEKKPTANFNPSQPRDSGGRWASGGSGGGLSSAAKEFLDEWSTDPEIFTEYRHFATQGFGQARDDDYSQDIHQKLDSISEYGSNFTKSKLFRGEAGLSDEDLNKIQSGAILQRPGWFSTSKDMKIAKEFTSVEDLEKTTGVTAAGKGKVLFEIYRDKSSPKNIDMHAMGINPEQKEVLLPGHQTQFRVLHTEKLKDGTLRAVLQAELKQTASKKLTTNRVAQIIAKYLGIKMKEKQSEVSNETK